jgi:hypothetical protein
LCELEEDTAESKVRKSILSARLLVRCKNLEDPPHWSLDGIYLETLDRFLVVH